MPTQIAQLAGQAGLAGIGTILGIGLEKHEDQRQLNQQDKLSYQQMGYDKQMTDYNYAKQFEMWKATNYNAQIEQLQKAGLNPGLLYGMGGGGGETIGTGGGAHVAAQAAPQGKQEIAAMGMQLAQMGLINAQTENVKQDTENKKEEVKNIPLTGEKTIAETTGLRLDNLFKEGTLDKRIDQVATEAENAIVNLDRNQTQLGLDRATVLQKADQIKADAIGSVLKNALIIAETKNENQNTEESKQRVNQSQAQINKWSQEILQQWQDINIKQQQLLLNKMMTEFEVEYPGFGRVIGQQMRNVLKGITDIITEIPTIDTKATEKHK